MLLKSYWVSWPQHKPGAEKTEITTQTENRTQDNKDKCHLIYLHLCETGRLTSLGFSLFPTPHRMTNVKGHRAAEPPKPQAPTLPSCHPKDGGGRQQKTTWHTVQTEQFSPSANRLFLFGIQECLFQKLPSGLKIIINKNLNWQGPGWGNCSYVLSEGWGGTHRNTWLLQPSPSALH